MGRIIDSSKVTRIRDASDTGKKISANFLIEQLGAKPVSTVSGTDLLQVRDLMQQMLLSRGGRPSLKNSIERVKVPKLVADWKAIESITERLGTELVFKPSQGQVAAVMLHWAVTRMSVEDVKDAISS